MIAMIVMNAIFLWWFKIFPIELKDDDSVIGRRSNKENLTLSPSIQSGEKSSHRRDKISGKKKRLRFKFSKLNQWLAEDLIMWSTIQFRKKSFHRRDTFLQFHTFFILSTGEEMFRWYKPALQRIDTTYKGRQTGRQANRQGFSSIGKGPRTNEGKGMIDVLIRADIGTGVLGAPWVTILSNAHHASLHQGIQAGKDIMNGPYFILLGKEI